MLIPRYTRTHRYLKITILCTSTCVYTHRYKNYTIYLHICKHILTYGRAGTIAGIPPITTSAGACTPCSRTLTPPSRSPPPPGCRCILPKGFIKTQRTEMGTHGVRRERGGVAYSCRQPPARGHHRGTVGVTALTGVPVLAPAVPSFHPCAPNPPRPCHSPAAGTAPGSPWQRWHTPMLPPGLGRWAAAAGLAAGMHAFKHHEDVEMDRTGKRGSRLGPGQAPQHSQPGSRAPTGLPSHPTGSNKTRHKHRDSPSLLSSAQLAQTNPSSLQ